MIYTSETTERNAAMRVLNNIRRHHERNIRTNVAGHLSGSQAFA